MTNSGDTTRLRRKEELRQKIDDTRSDIVGTARSAALTDLHDVRRRALDELRDLFGKLDRLRAELHAGDPDQEQSE